MTTTTDTPTRFDAQPYLSAAADTLKACNGVQNAEPVCAELLADSNPDYARKHGTIDAKIAEIDAARTILDTLRVSTPFKAGSLNAERLRTEWDGLNMAAGEVADSLRSIKHQQAFIRQTATSTEPLHAEFTARYTDLRFFLGAYIGLGQAFQQVIVRYCELHRLCMLTAAGKTVGPME